MQGLVGWANALAGPSIRMRDSRTPCPPLASMRAAPSLVGTAHARLSLVEKRCRAPLPTLQFAACTSRIFGKTNPWKQISPKTQQLNTDFQGFCPVRLVRGIREAPTVQQPP